MSDVIMKASMDTGPCYKAKKCGEIVFRKRIKGRLAVLEEKINKLDPNKKEICKSLEEKQAYKINAKQFQERKKKEIRGCTI